MLAQWIGCHQRAGDWHGAERAWARISELSLQPDSSSYRKLMQVYTRAGGEQLVKISPLLAEMQQSGVQLSVSDYERLIKTAHRYKLSVEVRRWSATARAAGLFDSLDEASRYITSHPANQVDSAVPASSEAPSSSAASSSTAASSSSSVCTPESVAAKSQLRIALLAGDSQTAQRIISEFEERGGQPDVMMLNQWIGCHQKARDWQGAERAWARISELSLKPDNVSYRTLINVYTHAGGDQLATIDPLLTRMQQSGVQLAVQDYQSLIKTAHQCDLHAEVRRWCAAVRAAGLFDSLDRASRRIASRASHRVASAVAAARIAPSSSAPTSSTAVPSSPLTTANYAALKLQLRSAMIEGDSSTASQLISAFEQRGGRCDVAMLNMWIGCHEQRGDWQGAERAWARFGERKLQPDSNTVCALLQVYTRAGGAQLAKIDPLLANLQECGVQLAAKDYQSLIKCAHHCKSPAEVRRWSALARAAGLFDSLDEASRGIASLLVNREDSAAPDSTDASSASSSSAAATDSAAVKSQLRIALSAGDAQTAQQIISEFEERGGRPDVMMLTQWISCHWKAGDWQGAERVWARIAELSLKPDSRSYCALMQVYTSAGGEHLAKIDPLLVEMQQRGVQLAAKDYQSLIKRAHGCKLPVEVRRWSEAACAAGLFNSLDETSRNITTRPSNRLDSAVPSSSDAPSASS